jgi:hypothetical protein
MRIDNEEVEDTIAVNLTYDMIADIIKDAIQKTTGIDREDVSIYEVSVQMPWEIF